MLVQRLKDGKSNSDDGSPQTEKNTLNLRAAGPVLGRSLHERAAVCWCLQCDCFAALPVEHSVSQAKQQEDLLMACNSADCLLPEPAKAA